MHKQARADANEANRRAVLANGGGRAIYQETLAQQQAREDAELAKFQLRASLGQGRRNIYGDNLTELGEQLAAQGYKMKKLQRFGERDSNAFIVPHPDRDSAIIRRVLRGH